MLDFRLFRVPTFTGAQTTAFVISAGMFAQFLFLPLYLENVLGYSAVAAGALFFPLVALSFVVARSREPLDTDVGEDPARRRAGPVRGRAPAHARDPADSSWTTLLAGFLVAGVGIGLVNAPLASTAVSVVEPQKAGMASGINNTFRQVGIATGVAALGAIFQSRIASESRRPRTREVRTPFSEGIASGATQRVLDALPPHSGRGRDDRTLGVHQRAEQDPVRRRGRALRRLDPRVRARPPAGLRRQRTGGRSGRRLDGGRRARETRAHPERELPGGDEEHHRSAGNDDERLRGDRERDRVCRSDAADHEDRGARARLGRCPAGAIGRAAEAAEATRNPSAST